MSTTLFSEVAIGLADHSGEAHSVGLHGRQFDAFLQFAVLLADA